MIIVLLSGAAHFIFYTYPKHLNEYELLSLSITGAIWILGLWVHGTSVMGGIPSREQIKNETLLTLATILLTINVAGYLVL